MADENTSILPKGAGIPPKRLEQNSCESNAEDGCRFTMLRMTSSVKAALFASLCALAVLFISHRSPSAAPVLAGSRSSFVTTTTDLSSLNEMTGAVLVTGATGRTGSILYHELKRRGVSDVRAFVRDVEKARTALGCVLCDETEGVYVGDLTEPKDLERAMADGSVKVLAVASGASGRSSSQVQRAVEFDAVISMVNTLAIKNGNADALRVVFCSSMGTTNPSPSFGGDILHWKLNAEAFLSSSGISSTVIVKPCGLTNGVGGDSTLVVGHHDTLFDDSPYYLVSRQDVANVMAESVMMAHDESSSHSNALRFDLCSIPGPGTDDLKGLIESSRWEWDK